MKKLLILSAVSIFTCNMCLAKIWRVNNNAGANADFTTAQLANDNASVNDGDTIHLEPSAISYGGLTVSKRLTWISTGAFLSIHPGEQFSPNPGKVDNLSVYVAGAANSVFHIYVDGACYINSSNVRLDRCFALGAITIQNFGYGIPTNVVVINCYSKGGLFINTGNSHIATNNIFEDGLTVAAATTLAVVTNNVFNAATAGNGVVYNSTVENNIFNKATTAITFNSCIVTYNMSAGASVLPAGNNNVNGVTMSTVFINNSGLDDASFVLKAGSPAIGTGSAGADMGAYGGSTPFKLAMQPAIPAIYKIQAPASPSGNTMNVTFSTKSNN